MDRRAGHLLAVVLILVVYGCLYPFSFSHTGKPMLAWEWEGGLDGVRDAVINLGLYFPVGLLLAVTITSRSRVLIATLSCMALSASIEVLQAFDGQRVSSFTDLLLNTIGGAMGARAASRLPRHMENPAPLAVIVLALLGRIYPLIPTIHPQWSPFRWDHATFAAADWLAVRFALRAFLKRDGVTRQLAIMLLVIPAGGFIMDQGASLSDLAGGVAALVIGHFWLRPRQFAPVMLLTVIARELLPFHLSRTPQAFHWIPFETYIGGPPALTALFLSKLAVYAGTLWLLDPESRYAGRIACSVAGLLFTLEWVQRYLAGRTPDITEPILVLIAATLLYTLRPVASAQARAPVTELASTTS